MFCSITAVLHIWNRLDRFSLTFDHPIVLFSDIKHKKTSFTYINDIHIINYLKETVKLMIIVTNKNSQLGLRLTLFVQNFMLLYTKMDHLYPLFRYDSAGDSMLSTFIFIMSSLLWNTIEIHFAKLNCNFYLNCIVYHSIVFTTSNVYICDVILR